MACRELSSHLLERPSASTLKNEQSWTTPSPSNFVSLQKVIIYINDSHLKILYFRFKQIVPLLPIYLFCLTISLTPTRSTTPSLFSLSISKLDCLHTMLPMQQMVMNANSGAYKDEKYTANDPGSCLPPAQNHNQTHNPEEHQTNPSSESRNDD